MASSCADSKRVQCELGHLQAESESAKAEVKDVLQALEELALSYDQKSREAQDKSMENKLLTQELAQKMVNPVFFYCCLNYCLMRVLNRDFKFKVYFNWPGVIYASDRFDVLGD